MRIMLTGAVAPDKKDNHTEGGKAEVAGGANQEQKRLVAELRVNREPHGKGDCGGGDPGADNERQARPPD